MPAFLVIAIGVALGLWGAYRVKLGLRTPEATAAGRKRGGLQALPNRTHLLVGIAFVLMAIMLVLHGLGIQVTDLLRR